MEVLNDFNTSVEKALSEIDGNWRSYDGLIVCGTHSFENAIWVHEKIRMQREEGKPFLGICAGHQMAWIEYCRNILGLHNATSEEFYDKGISFLDYDKSAQSVVEAPDFVVKKRKALKVGLHEGETWWSNYECVNEMGVPWNKKSNFITVPYHPEYQSSRFSPHPILVNFLNLCRGNADGRRHSAN